MTTRSDVLLWQTIPAAGTASVIVPGGERWLLKAIQIYAHTDVVGALGRINVQLSTTGPSHQLIVGQVTAMRANDFFGNAFPQPLVVPTGATLAIIAPAPAVGTLDCYASGVRLAVP